MGKKNKNQMPLSVNWTVKDDSVLKASVKEEIRELSRKISSASRPSVRKKYVDRRKKYRSLLKKLEAGDYGSEQFFLSEQNRGVYVNPNPVSADAGAMSAYDEIDFRYDEFFRKKRYYGFMLPFLLLILMAAFVVLPFLGNIIPTYTQSTVAAESGIHLGALFTFKLEADKDFLIENNGYWPAGTWEDGQALEDGEKFEVGGQIPDRVSVYRDLGMRTIDISGLDLLTAFFSTEMMSATRIDFIEDLPFLANHSSWYVARFMMQQSLEIGKDAEGNYAIPAVLRVVSIHIIAYGFTFAFLAACFGVLCSIISMFGYTSRRLHVFPLISFVISILIFIAPVFLVLERMPGDTFGDQFGAAMTAFFTFDNAAFMEDETLLLMTGFLPIINIVVSFFALLLPVMFKNRTAKYQTYVPKGNKPPRGTYDNLS